MRINLVLFCLTVAVFAGKQVCSIHEAPTFKVHTHDSFHNSTASQLVEDIDLACIPHYGFQKLLDSGNVVPPFARGYDEYVNMSISERDELVQSGGIMTLLAHQLGFATRIHLREFNSGIEPGSRDFLNFSPRLMRQLIILALFHDTEYYTSRSDHGSISGQYLEDLLDEDVLKFLVHHTSLTHYFEYEFYQLPDGEADHPLVEVEETLPRRFQRWFDLADWDIDYKMTPKWPVDGEEYDYRKHFIPLEFFLETYNIDVCEEEMFIWGAPSLWIERVPVLLANELKLWGKIRKRETGERLLFFDEVDLEVCNGGPELIEKFVDGSIHIGEIGIFPFINHARKFGMPDELNMKLIGSSFIAQLEHYLVSGNPDVKSVEDLRGKRVGVLSHGSCDSYLLDYILNHRTTFQMLDVDVVPLQKAYGKTDVLIPTLQRSDGDQSMPYVDACFLVDPGLAKAQKENSNVTVLQRAADLFPNFQWNALIASNEMLKQRIGNISKAHVMMEVYQKSVKYMHDAVVKYYPKLKPLPSSAYQNKEIDVYFDEINISDVLKALESIASEIFEVSKEALYVALARGFKDWRLKYANFDFEGAEVCTNLFQADFQEPLDVESNGNIPSSGKVNLKELFHVFNPQDAGTHVHVVF